MTQEFKFRKGKEEFEQNLFQMDKLNVLGLQAIGIVHEFNNILGTILGYLEIVKMELAGSSAQALDTLKVIEKAARDGVVIVDKVKEFSRNKKNHEKTEEFVGLIDLVNEALEFTMPRWKTEAQLKGVEYEIVKSNFGAPKYYIRCNSSEFRDAIINIINNSIDAMPNGGKIKFSVKEDGKNVVLSISDNGIGICEDVKDKIFEPFFTTKGIKRLGLGMSLVYSIMVKYGGEIKFKSSPGKGTTMHLRMPLVYERRRKGIARFEKQERIPFEQSANILVIEDEELILDMMKIILESKGHKVSISRDSNVGLKMYESNLYDIVLCDLAMPKFNGWKVAKYIKEYNAVRKKAKTTVVLITGSELNIESIDYKKEGVDYILNKPIEYENLYQIINHTTASLQKDVSVDSGSSPN